jgi:predicted transporter
MAMPAPPLTFLQAFWGLTASIVRAVAFVLVMFGIGLGIGYLLTERSVILAIAALLGVVVAAIGLAAWHMSHTWR